MTGVEHDRLTTAESVGEDRAFDRAIRPQKLEDYKGLSEQARTFLANANIKDAKFKQEVAGIAEAWQNIADIVQFFINSGHVDIDIGMKFLDPFDPFGRVFDQSRCQFLRRSGGDA